MQSGPRPFQIALIAIFVVLMFVGGVLFVTYQPSSQTDAPVFGNQVQIWGTLDRQVVNKMIQDIRAEVEDFQVVSYRQLDERTFVAELVDAIAEGRSPDVVLIPHTELANLRTKITPIPYDSQIPGYDQRTHLDTYADGAEIFTLSDGIYATPLAVDPLVMYWNRDIFSANNFAAAPRTWEEIVGDVVPTVVVRDFNRNILLSPIALGEFSNITNAFAIVSTLLLQGGSQMVLEDGRTYQVSLDRSVNANVQRPLTSALEFFTSFSTVNNPLYSWNRVQAQDTNAFAAGDLAVYLGLGSEYDNLARLNPNLNFDIAEVPQAAGTSVRRTYGDYYGLAILRASQNQNGALAAIRTIASRPQQLSLFSSSLSMAPARRDLLTAGSFNPIEQIRYRAAIAAFGWLSPEPIVATEAFADGVEDILSNRSSVSEAVRAIMFSISNGY
ncbi:MAG: extracellular solute-binding protein [Patescibacteria group bacterium]